MVGWPLQFTVTRLETDLGSVVFAFQYEVVFTADGVNSTLAVPPDSVSVHSPQAGLLLAWYAYNVI
jgi:hypothetical protein